MLGLRAKYPKGTILQKTTTVDQRVFHMTYWCIFCQAYINKYFKYEEEVPFGSLRDEAVEGWEDIKQEVILGWLTQGDKK